MLVGVCANCDRKFAEDRRLANAIQPLGADGVTHQGSMQQRKRSDFYRGGTNDLLGGHDPMLLANVLKP